MAPCGLTGRDALMLFVPVGWTIAGTAAAIYYFACPEDICPRTLPGCAALSSAVASFMFSVNLACYHTRRAFARRMLPERRRCFLVFKTIFSLFIMLAGFVATIPFYSNPGDPATFKRFDGFWLFVTGFWGLVWFIDLVCFHYRPSRMLGTTAHPMLEHDDDGLEDATSVKLDDRDLQNSQLHEASI